MSLNLINLFFSSKDTYNSQLNERYRDELSNHLDIDLDLWLEGGLFGGTNRNRVYGLSNTMTENLWMTHSASVIGCSQSIPTSQTLEFAAMLDPTGTRSGQPILMINMNDSLLFMKNFINW